MCAQAVAPRRGARTAWLRVGGLCRDERLERLGVAHGVSLRVLGDMKSAACRARALAQGGLAGKAPRLLKQVHGTEIVTILAAGEENIARADGWVSAARGVPVAVYVADCLPIFLWDEGLRAVGVLHAGWKGLAAGMPAAAVSAFRSLGLEADGLCVSIGPHAGPCCYRVGAEFRSLFRAESFVSDARGGLRLDLGVEAKARFVEAGVDARNVRVSGDCTICAAEDFFSFRRDRMERRILAFIARP